MFSLDMPSMAKWQRINELKRDLPESTFKEKMIALDAQIEVLVFSDMDRTEMKVQVDKLLKHAELIIEHYELLQTTEDVKNQQTKEILMRYNSSLEKIESSDSPLDEKNENMKKVISEWKPALKAATFFEKMNDIVNPELRTRLIILKGGLELEPSHLVGKGKIYNNLINDLIVTEPFDQPHVLLNIKIDEFITKWEAENKSG
jgi:hypothetical protein